MEDRKSISMAVLAHVDAGKTTLSEAMLYLGGSIRKAGRVDNGDAFLDTYAMERARGITIFSKQAVFSYGNMRVTLLDTPGHVDFSAEMERTLQALDYAVLVISGADGVQAHTETLWGLLKRYRVPVFLFVNKMDQPGAEKEKLLLELQRKLSGECIDFTETEADAFFENAATCDEQALERYLKTGSLPEEELVRLIAERKLFPCFFGSALKIEGVKELLEGILRYTGQPVYPEAFGARVFKIARDEQGNRLTYLKVTGGGIKVRQELAGAGKAGMWTEKINQIRIYSGEKYESVKTAEAGTVCAVTGLTHTYPGEGLGWEEESPAPVLEPVLTYRILLPEGMAAALALPKLRMLLEEEPELHIVWNERLQEIGVQLMGEVQMEVLKGLVKERCGFAIEFDSGNIVYKETIKTSAEGVGHFEPLRHYAEVHLLLEPGETGSGMQFAAECSEELLDGNWQRLVLTHLEEKEHVGVLTGSALTDMKITLIAGRSHQKHTEGGDFREAAYRAVRQGLMQAESVLLEPYYEFRLEVPEETVGRAMADIERMCGTFSLEPDGVITGRAPVFEMRDYQTKVAAYTKGRGRISYTPCGYLPCHNTEEVLEKIGYDAERDTENPSGSVFCTHGAGFVVSWEQVFDYMHVESPLLRNARMGSANDFSRDSRKNQEKTYQEEWIGTDEIDRILEQTYNANKRDKAVGTGNGWKRKGSSREAAYFPAVTKSYPPKSAQKEYLLVDGYNIIFAWDKLKELAAENMDAARGSLLDILSNYQAIRGCELIAVFDAYRVAGHQTETQDYLNIHVVYTKEAETADQYIEKFAHENGKKYKVTVATSDGLEQIIIRGSGCALLSARELEQEIAAENRQIQLRYQEKQKTGRNYLLDGLEEKIREAASGGDMGREQEDGAE